MRRVDDKNKESSKYLMMLSYEVEYKSKTVSILKWFT